MRAASDGAFPLYDDEGDGMDYLRGAYLKIPFRWEEATGTLLAGKAEGSLPVRTRLQVRLIRPDGLTETRTLDYNGEPVRLNF